MSRKTPYQRIMAAAEHGHGVQLSAAECRMLTLDDAIQTRATVEDENVEERRLTFRIVDEFAALGYKHR